MNPRRIATALAAGLIFGAGLCLSGMIDPRKVTAFLDVTGQWNPALAAVMGGAIGVHALLLRLGRRGATAAAPLARGAAGGIDARLLLGSAIFGVGWGLAGYCPGPAVVSLGFGAVRGLGFVAAMIAGARVAGALLALRRAPEPAYSARD